jgi:chromosome segregation and condensation protein ScpB
MSETTIEAAEAVESAPLISGESALTLDQLAALSGSDTAAARAVGLTVRQRSSGRFLDAHENSANDFRLVTRPTQNNDSQRWQFV